MQVKGPLGVFVMAFIAIVIGAALMTNIANSVTGVTQSNTVVNESAAFVNNTVTALDYRQLETLDSISNGTVTFVENTDYTVDLDQGKVTYLTTNATLADGDYDVSYTYRQVKSGVARTLTTLVIIMFALGILGSILYYLNPRFKDLIDGFR